MRKIFTWHVLLGAALIALSAGLYSLHFALFHDSHHIFIYLLGDVAFVSIEVLLVSLIIHHLLSVREKRAILKKMNMVIGAFFNEVGTGLLERLDSFDRNSREMRTVLISSPEWTSRDFKAAARRAGRNSFALDSRDGDLAELGAFLAEKRDFLLRLLENPNLLEHDSFTDLLWAVFHLEGELELREDLGCLPGADLDHLSGDMTRAYSRLVAGWMSYMGHLKEDYPYLYSLAVRTNPFTSGASAVVAG